MNAKQKLAIYQDMMHGPHKITDRYAFDDSAIAYSVALFGNGYRIAVTKTVHTNEKRAMGIDYDMRIIDNSTGHRFSDHNTHAARIIFNAAVHAKGKSK